MRLRWTKPAVQDLKSICDYVEERDGAATARRIAPRLYDGLNSLLEFPRKGGPRRLAVYRVREDTIEVNRILRGAQRLP